MRRILCGLLLAAIAVTITPVVEAKSNPYSKHGMKKHYSPKNYKYKKPKKAKKTKSTWNHKRR
jgi:hypothetical protein